MIRPPRAAACERIPARVGVPSATRTRAAVKEALSGPWCPAARVECEISHLPGLLHVLGAVISSEARAPEETFTLVRLGDQASRRQHRFPFCSW